ncbi:MAG: adenylate kinase [Candidatus Parcubacteria bacterium]|nr:nucleoside monophosphate kinase [Patescibacteria group bacterium]BCX16152.1 MAG: adenylate kinase [Candidatus Parcubacteria bacterium]
MSNLKKKVVVIFGTPGSGKGTQARLISQKFDLFNLDTGSLLRSIFSNPVFLKDKRIREEKKLNESGRLNTPEFVLDLLKKKVDQLFKEGLGIVFSGSPRTYFEAFGDEKSEGLISFLEKRYKRKNLFFFFIKTSEGESIKRNSQRTICSVCQTQLLRSEIIGTKLKRCPFCGGKLVRRKDDNPKVIKTRFQEFQERTQPVLEELKKKGYKIHLINGNLLPYKVFQLIVEKIK